MRVSEIRVKGIRVNQGLGVPLYQFPKYSKIDRNANLVNKAYLVNMLTRLRSWSKIAKNVLT